MPVPGGRLACVLQRHKSSVTVYQRQLVTALVLCLVPVSDATKQAALTVLHQVLQIEHDSLTSDTDDQGVVTVAQNCSAHLCMEEKHCTPYAVLNLVLRVSGTVSG